MTVRVQDNVIKAIVGRCALDMPGVAALCAGKGIQSLVGSLAGQSETRGIEIHKSEEEDKIDRIELHVVIERGQAIPIVAKNLQGAIKDIVAKMTDQEVSEIDVFVDEIRESRPAAPVEADVAAKGKTKKKVQD